MTDRSVTSRGEREGDILAAALAAFAARGYAATRLDDVARGAGVAKGTLYLYFPNKEALFEAVVRAAVVPRIERMEALVAQFDGPVEALLRDRFAAAGAALIESDARHVIRLVVAEAHRFPAIAAFYHETVVRRGCALIHRLVERGVARGEFRPNALTEFPQLAFAPFLMAVIWKAAFEASEPLDARALIAAHVDVLLDGIRER